MRLHFVLPGSLAARTGGTIYDRRIVEALRARGHEVRVHELPGRYPSPDAAAVRAAECALATIPDGETVVVDGLALGALPDLAEAEHGRLALVALVHHPLCDETGLAAEEARALSVSESRALAHVAGVITTSPFTLSRLRELDWLSPALRFAESVEPGVDPAPPADPWRADEPFHLVSVGSLTPRKAHGDAIEALARLVDLDWRWTIVGREDLDLGTAALVRAAIKERRLVPRVKVLGEIDGPQLRAVLASAHALLHPARYEGYGMVITEAVAFGLPVIASTGGALAQTIPTGAGLTFPPGDVGALERALRSALSSPRAYGALRTATLEARDGLRSWDDAGVEFARALAGRPRGPRRRQR